MKKLNLIDFKDQKVEESKTLNLIGGRMTCHQLADQLDWMWDQGGSHSDQADNIMYLIEAGYDLCD